LNLETTPGLHRVAEGIVTGFAVVSGAFQVKSAGHVTPLLPE